MPSRRTLFLAAKVVDAELVCAAPGALLIEDGQVVTASGVVSKATAQQLILDCTNGVGCGAGGATWSLGGPGQPGSGWLTWSQPKGVWVDADVFGDRSHLCLGVAAVDLDHAACET